MSFLWQAWPRHLARLKRCSRRPSPQNKKELQSYLGLMNLYRTFLPNLSSHLQPLHLLLRDGQQWAWRKKQDLAFQRSKELITKAPVLVHFDPDQALQASPRGVCGALKLAAYSYRLVYRPGKDLAPVDALSRLPLPEVPAAVPEPAEVFMLEHAYPEVLSRSVSVAGNQPGPGPVTGSQGGVPRGGVG
ncbi:hypothetical protein MRX96_038844 [Rhipicephalus microplus]